MLKDKFSILETQEDHQIRRRDDSAVGERGFTGVWSAVGYLQLLDGQRGGVEGGGYSVARVFGLQVAAVSDG